MTMAELPDDKTVAAERARANRLSWATEVLESEYRALYERTSPLDGPLTEPLQSPPSAALEVAQAWHEAHEYYRGTGKK